LPTSITILMKFIRIFCLQQSRNLFQSLL